MDLTSKIFRLIVLLALFPSSSGRLRESKKSTGPTSSNAGINEKECDPIFHKVPPSRRFLKNHKVRQLCVRLNETELLNKLKGVGGFNPLYMAISNEDTRTFRDTSEDEQFLTSPQEANQDPPLKEQLDTEVGANDLNYLQDEIKNLANKNNQWQKRKVALPPGSIDHGCRNRGSLLDSHGTKLKRLCTECASQTKLPAGVFPPYVNEVRCGDADGNCFGPIGKCAQRNLSFTFLRHTGRFKKDDDLSHFLGVDAYKEEWEEYRQDIGFCCECRLFPQLTNIG